MNRAAVFFFVALTAISLLAQQAQQKPAADARPDFSGMYSFLHDGEFVQITLEDQGNVTGFISRYGDLDSDRGAFLDQFFKKASTDGTNLQFSTEQVHGIWYEFQGTVARGDGKTPNDEGYYVIKGKLTKYSSDANKKTTAESRELVMKSFPQDEEAEPPARRD